MRMIKLHKMVVLHSKSGLGKSSLLNAGVIPLLQDEGMVEPVMVRFGAYDPQQQNAPTQITQQAILGQFQSGSFLDRFETDRSSFWYASKCRQILDDKEETILIFDQFEELFTYPAEEIERFKKQLAEMLVVKVPEDIRQQLLPDWESRGFTDDEIDLLFELANIRIVFAIRSDRFHLMDRFKTVLPAVLKNVYELLPLDRNNARQAIIRPALVSGNYDTPPFDYAPLAIDHILNFLEDKDGFIESIQLQILCQSFEDKVKQAGLTIITMEEVDDLENIISNYYFDKIEAIENTEDREKAERFIEEGLVLEEGQIRLSMHEGQIYRLFDVGPTLLSQLVDSHLLRSEPARQGMEGYIYELSHDTLVPPVLEAKRKREEIERQEELKRIQLERQQEQEENRRKRRKILFYLFLAMAATVASLIGIVWIKDSRDQLAKQNVILAERDSTIRIKNSALLKSQKALEEKQANLQVAYEELQAVKNSLEIQADSLVSLTNELQYKNDTLNAFSNALKRQRDITNQKNRALQSITDSLNDVNQQLRETETELSENYENLILARGNLEAQKVKVEQEARNARISWLLSEAINLNLSGKRADKDLAKMLTYTAYQLNQSNTDQNKKAIFEKDIYRKASLIAEDIIDLKTLNNNGPVRHIVQSPGFSNTMLTNGPGGAVYIWKYENKSWKVSDRLLQRNSANTPLECLIQNQDNNWILSGNKEGKLTIWSMEEGSTPKWERKIHDGALMSISFIDEKQFFTSGADGTVYKHLITKEDNNKFDIETTLWYNFDHPVFYTSKIDAAKSLLVGRFDRIDIIDANNKEQSLSSFGIPDSITAMTTYGQRIVYGNQNGQLGALLYDRDQGLLLPQGQISYGVEKSQVTAIEFDRSGQQLAVGWAKGIVKLIPLSSADFELELDKINEQNLQSLLLTIAFSSTNNKVLVGTGTEQYKIYIFSKSIEPILIDICQQVSLPDNEAKAAFFQKLEQYLTSQNISELKSRLDQCIK